MTDTELEELLAKLEKLQEYYIDLGIYSGSLHCDGVASGLRLVTWLIKEGDEAVRVEYGLPGNLLNEL